MSCADIYITINSDPVVQVTLEGGGGSGNILIDQTFHKIEDAAEDEYLLKNGQTFKENSLIVFMNGLLLSKFGDNPDYLELEDKTGIQILIELDDEVGDEDEITMFYAVA